MGEEAGLPERRCIFSCMATTTQKRRAALRWLEIDVDAVAVTEDEVRTAYKRLAKVYHPDKNGGSAEAVARWVWIVEVGLLGCCCQRHVLAVHTASSRFLHLNCNCFQHACQ